nr:N-6 DNA methylase [Candidatus Delongbacteria bacterium]
QTDGKKADGAILKDGNAIAVIELKSTKTKELKSITEQAFNYKNNQPECKYVITSNFQKLRFYIDHSNEYIEFNLFNLPKDEFEILYLVLAKESIFADTPTKLKEETIYQEENISKQLYKDYSNFKNKLFENLVKNNPQNDKLTLFKKSQKLIDRFLFILFAEDRGLLPPNLINSIIQRYKILEEQDFKQPIYDIYKQFFGYLNTGHTSKKAIENIPAYNGGLFYPDEILDRILIDDETLITDLQNLSSYDFNTEVDVNILGHIFEHSLSEIEEITAEIEGITSSKTKRKKDGVFYTPKYITQYIVENTIGRLCLEKRNELELADIEIDDKCYLKSGKLSEKGKKIYSKIEMYKSWLLTLKIVDPACGSGAFLNQALNFLIEEHQFIIDLETDLNKGQISLFNIEKAVLENNLYGVDINEESVEIAKLSLWLRTAQKGRKLSVLSNNIKCGNSLIDNQQVAGKLAFDWEKEFPDVMKNGGFNIVIGNPPYGAFFSKPEKEYIKAEYKTYQYKFESYLYFFEKGINLLAPKGVLSFITPELFLRLDKSENIRKYLYNNIEVTELKFCGENVFSDVKVNSVIVTLSQKNNAKNKILIIPLAGQPWNYNLERWHDTPSYKIEYEISPTVKAIIDKIEAKSTQIDKIGDAIQGLTPYDSYRGHSKELIKSRGFHFKQKGDETCGEWLDGKHVTRYGLAEGDEWLKYGEWLAAPREKKYFEGPRLLFREVPGKNKRIQATFAEKTYYHGHSITPLILKPKFSNSKEKLFEILGVANSTAISWFAKYKSSNFSKNVFPKLNPKDIKNLPFPQQSDKLSLLAPKVEELLKLYSKYNKIGEKLTRFIINSTTSELLSNNLKNWQELNYKQFIRELNKSIKKTSIEKLSKLQEMEWMEIFETNIEESKNILYSIHRIDKEIDQLVYAIYQLSEKEIQLIENSQQ